MIETNVILRKNRKSKNIYLRIKPHNTKLSEVSAGLFCKPNQWHSKDWCKTTGKMSQEDRHNNTRTNVLLKEMIQGYVNAWDKLHEKGQRIITLNDLKNYQNGTHELAINRDRRLTFREAVNNYLDWKRLRVKNVAGYEASFNTVEKILGKLEKADITIDNFNERVASNVINYMLNNEYTYMGKTKNYSYSTRVFARSNLKRLFDYFYQYKNQLSYRPLLPDVHPFQYVKVEKTKEESKAIKLRETHFYSEEEIYKIKTVELSPMLNYYRNVLLFQIYTGISFVDISTFDPLIHLFDEGDDGFWINFRRTKTNGAFNIPIEENVIDLIDFFLENKELSNAEAGPGIIITGASSNYHRYLDRVGRKIGIKITESHKARHTFAMRMLNAKMCTLEEVGAMLGHGNLASTQMYAMVTREKQIQAKRIREGKHLTVTKSKMTGTH